ncbi:MAG: 2,5-diamino-6-(ribosylamino)-4(3H)-pyrimidinone 5'-phosphate reductase [Candidatus Methanoliparum thermophilum]|uniref:2,5-diamino-6-(ribosylamino)-4(3H)-pyrimidinone 5'-phosphate reductase n=1 Tax=Methanoliparum thermophilum TaxID=2491083 RepID=A0A520KU45_METT2|nr:2,5-diamino-6-(ribosylamino)-4(3H)-pyrimidinone 5'-phosphate reductase [Candidatus Methanoliparum sp. LAM-1]RZN65638.1 MAG: 2,5-diamino-6-(ribosylamino)-4(3H)-pyrimidinone 5'-phosphate reductase [Candidatus Methanoliparum thermophilum]BDC36521.1 diaminohydroxyphosphoribosylaminopyrimidine reductase [Candidatus Methanoliparum sp. LAM-1]
MRPFVFINMAMSADGKISNRLKEQIKLSGKEDLDRVDRLKNSVDAVMVGIGTILSDNPSLTIKSDEIKRRREERGIMENPIRIIVDSKCRIPLDSDVLNKGKGERIIITSYSADKDKVDMLSKYTKIIRVGADNIDLVKMMKLLYDKGIKRIMVEGGGELAWGLINARLVDELYYYISPIIIGGRDSPTPVDGDGFVSEFPKLELIEFVKIDSGLLMHWKVL